MRSTCAEDEDEDEKRRAREREKCCGQITHDIGHRAYDDAQLSECECETNKWPNVIRSAEAGMGILRARALVLCFRKYKLSNSVSGKIATLKCVENGL